MVKNSTDINKTNNHLSPQLIENVFKTFPVCVCWCVWEKRGGIVFNDNFNIISVISWRYTFYDMHYVVNIEVNYKHF